MQVESRNYSTLKININYIIRHSQTSFANLLKKLRRETKTPVTTEDIPVYSNTAEYVVTASGSLTYNKRRR